MALKYFQCFLDKIAEILTLPLAVVDPVATVHYIIRQTLPLRNFYRRINNAHSSAICKCIKNLEISAFAKLHIKLKRKFNKNWKQDLRK